MRRNAGEGAERHRHEAGEDNPALPLPDKPSIAALPFANMSGDPEQEYFADGMVEEVICPKTLGIPPFSDMKMPPLCIPEGALLCIPIGRKTTSVPVAGVTIRIWW
jgi:hypothetical protein